MAVEEVFINIASYAYAPGEGTVRVNVKVTEDPDKVVITFTDRGIPYDPLKMESPNVNLPADQRQVGGLGVFLVKNTMDDVAYEFKDGQNILTITKNL
jgi:anti-sigma regulatory factor (Ser/Thr protein kinase)